MYVRVSIIEFPLCLIFLRAFVVMGWHVSKDDGDGVHRKS